MPALLADKSEGNTSKRAFPGLRSLNLACILYKRHPQKKQKIDKISQKPPFCLASLARKKWNLAEDKSLGYDKFSITNLSH